MRFLHCSDLHLGLKGYSMPERLSDMAAVLPQIAAIAIQAPVSFVVDAGDTFDSPEPDPFSVKAYRRFAQQLQDAKIPLLSIVGNHNRHNVTAQLGEGAWPSAVHSWVKCPEDKSGWIDLDAQGYRLVAANWMPRPRMLEFLENMKQNPPDILIMHQLCGGFIPKVASNSEVSFEELAGAAHCICIGDVHVKMEHRCPDGTLIVSTGSTEMTKNDEEPDKWVALIECARVPGSTTFAVHFEPLQIRPQWVSEIRSQVEIGEVEKRIAESQRQPLVHIVYHPSMYEAVEELKVRVGAAALIRAVPDHVVDTTRSYEAAKNTANSDMPGIIGEIINDDPALRDCGSALWSNPDNGQAVLAALKDSIRSRLAPAALPAPTP